jgi:hypothetical protein
MKILYDLKFYLFFGRFLALARSRFLLQSFAGQAKGFPLQSLTRDSIS